MPTNLSAADASFPQLTEKQSTDEKIEKIQSYLYMLLESLRFQLSNIEKENFNDTAFEEISDIITEPVYVQISDVEGNISTLTQQSNALTTRVSNSEGKISTLQQTAQSITLNVTNSTDSSTIQLSADGITTQSKTIKFTGGVVFKSDLSTKGSTTINGANITTGTLSGDRISGGTITGTTISGGTITGTTISGGTITGTTISGGTITSAKLYSPTIYGSTINLYSQSGSASFNLYSQSDSASFNLWTRIGSNYYNILQLSSWDDGINAKISSPAGGEITLSGNVGFVSGTVQFTGTVDFTSATVKGLS